MDDPLVPELVEAIADAKGIDADALDIQLQEYIGVDVIQTLMSHETAS